MSRFTRVSSYNASDFTGAMSDNLTSTAAGALAGTGAGLCLGLVPQSITGLALMGAALMYSRK